LRAYYNPATDRFLSRDPYHGHIGSQSTLHKYSYASADPVNRVDPLGLEDAIEVGGPDSAIETIGRVESPDLSRTA
jgi:hypothetical protein